MKGIIYIMRTAVSGLIKIGQTGTGKYQERMRNLETNGYYNVSGLKRFFAIELEDYKDKENLLKEIFNKHRVGDSELFALDYDLVRQLLLSFDGKVIYPKDVNKEKEFDEVSKTRKQGAMFSFYKKGIKNGEEIVFITDKEITAKVVGEREVEYGEEIWKLSPLTYKIYEQKGKLSPSGTYRGADHFEYNGKKLKDLPDREKEFDSVSKVKKRGELFSFYKKGLKNGDEIVFSDDKEITAKVFGKGKKEKAIKEKVRHTLEDHLGGISPKAKKIFEAINEKIVTLDESIIVEPKAKYIAYKLATNFVDIVVNQSGLKIYLNMPSGELNDPHSITRDLTKPKKIGHWGNGDYEVKLEKEEEINQVFELIKQSYTYNK